MNICDIFETSSYYTVVLAFFAMKFIVIYIIVVYFILKLSKTESYLLAPKLQYSGEDNGWGGDEYTDTVVYFNF